MYPKFLLQIAMVLMVLFVFYESAEAQCNVRCRKSPKKYAEECLDDKKAFIPPDNKHNCCGHCKPIREVVSSRYFEDCDRDKCRRSKCRNEDYDDCKRNEVLVPRDGKCFCCNQCVREK